MERPSKLYKYLDFKGLTKTLEDATLKYTNPVEFNDPFDTLFQVQLKSIVDEDTLVQYIDYFELPILVQPPMGFRFERGAMIKQTFRHSLFNRFPGRPKQQIECLKAILLGKTLEDESLEVFRGMVRGFLRSTYVSCFSETGNNLLMWAHYSDKHKGGVIEFSSEFIDSLRPRSVDYQDKYPRLSIDKWLQYDTPYLSGDMWWDFLLVKSQDWSYEREWRTFLHLDPEDVGGEYYLCPFMQDAIKGIYLGCAMPEQNQKAVVDIVNKNYGNTSRSPKVYIAQKHHSEYQLDYICYGS